MAIQRDRPYVQFNFLVDLGTGNTDGADAGFQECTNIGMEVTVAEYRNGDWKAAVKALEKSAQLRVQVVQGGLVDLVEPGERLVQGKCRDFRFLR